MCNQCMDQRHINIAKDIAEVYFDVVPSECEIRFVPRRWMLKGVIYVRSLDKYQSFRELVIATYDYYVENYGNVTVGASKKHNIIIIPCNEYCTLVSEQKVLP